MRLLVNWLSRNGIHVFRRGMPWGADLFRDIRLLGGIPDTGLIFDVGANEGQTLKRVKTALPHAQVHCFEPVKDTFEQLSRVARSYVDVQCHQMALSSKPGQARVIQAGVSVMNQIEPTQQDDVADSVMMRTVDSVCEKAPISRIHLLKIDTEGHDLEVLRGAAKMLHAKRIDYILTEVGFGDADRFCIDIEMRRYLAEFGYRLLGVYDQAPTVYGHGWGHVGLYFANLLFVRPGHPPRKKDKAL